jgi:coproporphyrinogen III oxidase
MSSWLSREKETIATSKTQTQGLGALDEQQWRKEREYKERTCIGIMVGEMIERETICS